MNLSLAITIIFGLILGSGSVKGRRHCGPPPECLCNVECEADEQLYIFKHGDCSFYEPRLGKPPKLDKNGQEIDKCSIDNEDDYRRSRREDKPCRASGIEVKYVIT